MANVFMTGIICAYPVNAYGVTEIFYSTRPE